MVRLQLCADPADMAARSLGDFLAFEVDPDPEHAFGVDIGFGDPMLTGPDDVVADDVLGFAGLPPPTLRLYPIETHLAEMQHAYTMPRSRPNSRVKDCSRRTADTDAFLVDEVLPDVPVRQWVLSLPHRWSARTASGFSARLEIVHTLHRFIVARRHDTCSCAAGHPTTQSCYHAPHVPPPSVGAPDP